MSRTGAAYLLKAGDTLGDYTVVRPIGAGGMGQVYLVEHRHLRKRYALKILPVDLADDSAFVDRFRIEARVMADLEHPGIVRVHNYGSEKGRHYLVMDYVSGPDGAPRTLDDDLAWGNKLDAHAVLDIAIQLCDALEYAHTFPSGAIIHRDLKPGNILIHRPGTQTGQTSDAPAGEPAPTTRVKIADFGLARIVGTDYIREVIDRSTQLTAVPLRKMSPDDEATEVNTEGPSTVSVLGTYDYMSPEQKTGTAVDARSDIYALGLILYRMLTGHKPEGTYDPPSRSGVSRRWDPVIAKCLKRDAGERYQSAAELKQALLKLRQPIYRQPVVLVGAAVAALILLFALPRGNDEGGASTERRERPKVEVEAGPGEVLIPFRFDVRPAGGEMTLRHGSDVIFSARRLDRTVTSEKLKPGVYNVHIERDGHRTIDQQVAVAEDLPKRWTVELEPSFGYVHVRAGDGRTVIFHDRSGRQVNTGEPERADGKQIFRLPTGRYEAVITLPDHEPESRKVTVTEARPADLAVDLMPLPGSIRVNSSVKADLWVEGTLMGRTGSWIKKVRAGQRDVELRREGYRTVEFKLDVPPNGQVEMQAPDMAEEFAEIGVSVAVRGVSVPESRAPRTGSLRVGEQDLGQVELPWSDETKLLEQPVQVSLEIDGYKKLMPETVWLRDGDHKNITFWLDPIPIRVTVLSEVEAGIYRLKDGETASGWKRLLFGRDVPIARTGETIELDAFRLHNLTVMAEGYEPETVTIDPADPDQDLEFRVSLTASKPSED